MILTDQISKESIDLCKDCAEDFQEWKKPLEPEVKKRGRPKKDVIN